MARRTRRPVTRSVPNGSRPPPWAWPMEPPPPEPSSSGRAVKPADDLALRRVHPPWYLEALDAAAARGGGWIDGDTYLGAGSMRRRPPGGRRYACRRARRRAR